MPGLFGYWTETEETPSPELLAALAGAMQHRPDLKVETALYPGFGGGRVHLGHLQPQTQPVRDETGRYSVWLDGEFRNRGNLVSAFGLDSAQVDSDAALTVALYKQVGWSFLRHVDGLFAIAFYDRVAHQLSLASDRYGLRPLYWGETPNGFTYAGEVKVLLRVPGVETRIDSQAVSQWFSFSYLLGDRTWIEGIQLLPPATVMRISERGITQERYWSWQELVPLRTDLREAEIVEELGRLWIQAVKRSVDEKRLAVSLSGGLDSRSVLAAIPDSVESLHAVTFGKAGCHDYEIAKRVAKLRGVPHHFSEISSRNWLGTPRIEGVWRTDGMAPILDLHGLEASATYSRFADVDIQSFAGDLILGGSYLAPEFIEDWGHAFEVVFARMYRRSILVSEQRAKDLLSEVFADYAALPHSDFFFLDSRVRRFTNCGTVALQSVIERRCPTFDSELIRFVYSLGSGWRLDGRVYHQMLLRSFPRYYQDIPWQKTGLPIAAPAWRRKASYIERALDQRLLALTDLLRIPTPLRNRPLADYAAWMRQEPARSLIHSLLLDVDPLSLTYLDRAKIRQVVSGFMDGLNQNATAVGSLLTFEIYLRQLFGLQVLPDRESGEDESI